MKMLNHPVPLLAALLLAAGSYAQTVNAAPVPASTSKSAQHLVLTEELLDRMIVVAKLRSSR